MQQQQVHIQPGAGHEDPPADADPDGFGTENDPEEDLVAPQTPPSPDSAAAHSASDTPSGPCPRSGGAVDSSPSRDSCRGSSGGRDPVARGNDGSRTVDRVLSAGGGSLSPGPQARDRSQPRRAAAEEDSSALARSDPVRGSGSGSSAPVDSAPQRVTTRSQKGILKPSTYKDGTVGMKEISSLQILLPLENHRV